MSKKINIMDVNIDICTAKEAMKMAVKDIDSDPINIYEMMTSDMLLQLSVVPEVKEKIDTFDLLLAGETTLLEAAGISEKKCLQETQNRVFLKMFMRYLHKQHKRVYLLADTDEEINDFRKYMKQYYSGIQIAGATKMELESRADDMIVNAINGSEPDCVLSVVSSPLQEAFITKNKGILNTHVWMGLGKEIIPVCKKKMKKNWFTQFIVKWILQKEIEKGKKNGGN